MTGYVTDLATEDILGVELVRAGGPFFGQGSAAGGDYITRDHLVEAVHSFRELRDELWAPVKLGHNRRQDALREDGQVTEGAPPNPGLLDTDGAPAAGWLDNLRVEGDRLLADLRRVPRVVASLVRAGAYRARSIEFWRGYRDATGKRHPLVITGVALLGAKLPAVRGLRDLVTLYDAETGAAVSFDQATPEDAQVVAYEVAAGPTSEDQGGGQGRPHGEGTDAPPDTAGDPPATPPDGGDQDPDGSNDERAAGTPTPDTEGTMPQTIAPELLTALGLGEDADLDAAVAKVKKLAEGAETATSLSEKLETAEGRITALESAADGDVAALAAKIDTLTELAQDGVEARKELARLEREGEVDKAIRERRLAPGQRDEWLSKYEDAPAVVKDLLGTLPVRTDLAEGEAGTDEKGPDAGELSAAEEDAAYTAAFGVEPRDKAARGQEA
jgi:hypothetical protein